MACKSTTPDSESPGQNNTWQTAPTFTTPLPTKKVKAITCHLLDNVPAEIRNRIYELAFTCEDEIPVDLMRAAPPSKTALLTCRQIYSEAKLMHREAYREYWRGSRFQVVVDGNFKKDRALFAVLNKDADAELRAKAFGWAGVIRDEDVRNIANLQVHEFHEGELVPRTYYARNGVWTFNASADPSLAIFVEATNSEARNRLE